MKYDQTKKGSDKMGLAIYIREQAKIHLYLSLIYLCSIIQYYALVKLLHYSFPFAILLCGLCSMVVAIWRMDWSLQGRDNSRFNHQHTTPAILVEDSHFEWYQPTKCSTNILSTTTRVDNGDWTAWSMEMGQWTSCIGAIDSCTVYRSSWFNSSHQSVAKR